MASSLISGAVVLMLILIAGYVITDGVLTIVEKGVITNTDMTLTQENILHTSFNITSATSINGGPTTLYILNTGTTSFNMADPGMDLFLCRSGANTISRETTFVRTIQNDITNKGFWDPSEVLIVTKTVGLKYPWAKFVTPNGITASIIIS